MNYTNGSEYRKLTVEEQYVSFVGQCCAVAEAVDFFDGSQNERRREIVQTIRDISKCPAYTELALTCFSRPSTELPQPDPLVERIVLLMNKYKSRRALVQTAQAL